MSNDRVEYCYLITFKETKQIYLGSRTCKNADPEEFWNPLHKTAYFTSSKTVNALIKIYGIDAFTVDGIKIFPTGGALIFESDILGGFDVKNSSMWLNKSSNCNRECDNVSDKIWVNNGTVEFYWKKDAQIPNGLSKGRLMSKVKGTKRAKVLRWLHHPVTNKNIQLEENKIEYYINKGYTYGQSNGAAMMTWYTNGIDSIYSKEKIITSGWYLGRTNLKDPRLITIICPHGISYKCTKEFNNYIKSDIKSPLKVHKIARKYVNGESVIITKRHYDRYSSFFNSYGFDANIVGKDWNELGFTFKRNLQYSLTD